MTKEYIIYCDESIGKGEYYSNFFGGVLIDSANYDSIVMELLHILEGNGISSELKWQNVSAPYWKRYCLMIDEIFRHVKNGDIKIRVMFTDNSFINPTLKKEHTDNKYFKLYYQFIKHAFGLSDCNLNSNHDVHLKFFFDELPDKKTKNEGFKSYIYGLQSLEEFKKSRIKIQRENITEVNSKEHLLLQGLDIILGAIAFRTNQRHLEKAPNSNKRGKRTIAKEKLYKHINSKIQEIKPHFNICVNTGWENKTDLWTHPYRHWIFKSKDALQMNIKEKSPNAATKSLTYEREPSPNQSFS